MCWCNCNCQKPATAPLSPEAARKKRDEIKRLRAERPQNDKVKVK